MLVNWNRVETVLLDMDGTLLDLGFDNHFWLEFVPQRYAGARGMDATDAREQVYARYRAAVGTLDWYCVDHWTRELELDIMALARERRDGIRLLPHTVRFLDGVRATGRQLWLVTNAHRKTLELKLAETGIGQRFDRIVCSHDHGAPKEHVEFWERMIQLHPFSPAHALMVDDSLPVLEAATRFGVGQVLAVSRPDLGQPPRHVRAFPVVHDLSEVIP
ncbi:MAG: GMP/IMP nucleotidase [Chromatiales bacterium]|nr:GMP/IMP nucleotidase [Chromatiales bacterium]